MGICRNSRRTWSLSNQGSAGAPCSLMGVLLANYAAVCQALTSVVVGKMKLGLTWWPFFLQHAEHLSHCSQWQRQTTDWTLSWVWYWDMWELCWIVAHLKKKKVRIKTGCRPAGQSSPLRPSFGACLHAGMLTPQTVSSAAVHDEYKCTLPSNEV